MKKFTYLFAALSMMAVSANAQQITNEELATPEFGGELVTLQNPSFEEFEGDDGSVTAAHLKGWETKTSGINWDGKTQKSMPENTNGSWYARCINTGGNLETSVIFQNVTGKGAGVYVLSAGVCVSRNGQKGDIDAVGKGAMFGYLYIMDNEDLDWDATKYLKIGECLATNPRKFVVYETPSAADGGGGSLQIGFGLPEESQALSKGWLQCDAFKLEYVPGKTKEEVQAMVDAITTGIQTIKTVNEKAVDANAPIYNLNGVQVNPNALQKGIYIKQGKKFIVR